MCYVSRMCACVFVCVAYGCVPLWRMRACVGNAAGLPSPSPLKLDLYKTQLCLFHMQGRCSKASLLASLPPVPHAALVLLPAARCPLPGFSTAPPLVLCLPLFWRSFGSRYGGRTSRCRDTGEAVLTRASGNQAGDVLPLRARHAGTARRPHGAGLHLEAGHPPPFRRFRARR